MSVSKSCRTCPALLSPEESTSFFRKSVGAPMCARFGHVLGKPGLKPVQENVLMESFGTKCPSHGQERPIQAPERPSLHVAIGDPEVMIAGPSAPAERTAVTSCLGCKNFVRDSGVATDLGWPSGLCAASGRLILPHRTGLEAKDCDYRAPGSPRGTTAGIMLLPVYEDAFGVSTDPVAMFMKKKHLPVVDPTDYPTDKPVDAEDAEAGIRAWRKVMVDLDRGTHTYLPIFRTDFFEPVEQAKIPRTGDDEHPEWYIDHNNAVGKVAVLWRELDETPALWGPAGVGKTEFFRHLAWLMHLPFDRISITDTTEVDDLAGKWTAVTDPASNQTVTKFQYGRVVKRWQTPGILLLDEPNVGPDAVWQFVRPLTDNSKQLVLDQNEGERISRHLDCYLGMAMNPAWDVKNVGARPISDADGNRLAHLSFTLPPEPLERAILTQRCGDDDYEIPTRTLDSIMTIAKEIRRAADLGTIPISWGIRPQIKVARATKWFDLPTCYRLAVTDGLDPEQQQFVMQIVSDHDATGQA